ncbi:MAG: hypothetical protein H0U86_04255 [Chloroflexi bacterium]|nr:hypothetical protein [Chloroflexota bacterium]
MTTRKQDQPLLVEFDLHELRHAIQQNRKRAEELQKQVERCLTLAHLYDELLRVHGVSNGDIDELPVIARSNRFEGMTVAEAALIVLRDASGKLSGREIMEKLAQGGREVGGKQPMGTLATLMKRDDRIERVPGETNMWRLSNVGRKE